MKIFKIVYIDDEQDLINLFVDDFSNPGFEIKGYTDPHVAIEEISNYQPDVIFIDYRLPRYTGDQIAMLLPSRFRKVLVTGDLSVKPNFAFDKIVYKPYDFDEVKNYILSLAGK